MKIITDIISLRTYLKDKQSVSFVPTMGNLHEGHLSLVRTAKQHADYNVVSIFVNRLQFSPNEDFNQYPRTFERDCSLLKEAGVNVIFAPSEKILYPVQQEFLLSLPPLARTLEGRFRPDFFQGVATIVLKLFNIVQPKTAVFGKKDYQQLLLVREMVQQLNLPIEIISGETARSSNGLALSSRNNYLREEQRLEACRLYQSLLLIKQEVISGNTDFKMLEINAIKNLIQHGWKVDYITIQRSTLTPAKPNDKDLVVLGAAWLGKTRLIDNLEILD
ncbi:pantothenate synthetase [Nitrosomonas cryotolerans]|uniref:Pantothenate synthetase n=1 Tax=Nitrosomonas cryotolerans ATCC 49181 TaxID=1131553 RepID=A0A1N6F3U9_9PROT|nr:pantoate--beta-alanine ligase [Nitrosomonas cryotolerans]SFP70580.1 pantothenate synthetase [Nitrosomonas cryotolerans]SIN89968.1 pantothenate synthetase [Nitrosomonas cryotolerans ATCC 49181]